MRFPPGPALMDVVPGFVLLCFAAVGPGMHFGFLYCWIPPKGSVTVLFRGALVQICHRWSPLQPLKNQLCVFYFTNRKPAADLTDNTLNYNCISTSLSGYILS